MLSTVRVWPDLPQDRQSCSLDRQVIRESGAFVASTLPNSSRGDMLVRFSLSFLFFPFRLLDVLVRLVGGASANVQHTNESLGISISSPACERFSTGPALLASSDASVDGNSTGRGKEDGSPSPSPTEPTPLPRGSPLVRHGMRLKRDAPGRVAAHRDVGVHHTFAFWVREVQYHLLYST